MIRGRRAGGLRAVGILTSVAALMQLWTIPAVADIELRQPAGKALVLEEPARRIISLAPHLVELSFEAGAGDLLLATVAYSDYPAAARDLPRIGDAFRFDLERILSLKPDLILAWDSGNPSTALAALEQLGLPVWHININTLQDIARAIEDLGRATDRAESAGAAANQLRADINRLTERYAGSAGVKYFYQVSARPLYTVNGEHLISQALALCGGHNVFAGVASLAPQISPEAVLQANPQVLLAGSSPGSEEHALDHWREWPRLEAVKNRHLYYLNADTMNRASVRMLQSVERACQLFEQVRKGQT